MPFCSFTSPVVGIHYLLVRLWLSRLFAAFWSSYAGLCFKLNKLLHNVLDVDKSIISVGDFLQVELLGWNYLAYFGQGVSSSFIKFRRLAWGRSLCNSISGSSTVCWLLYAAGKPWRLDLVYLGVMKLFSAYCADITLRFETRQLWLNLDFKLYSRLLISPSYLLLIHGSGNLTQTFCLLHWSLA